MGHNRTTLAHSVHGGSEANQLKEEESREKALGSIRNQKKILGCVRCFVANIDAHVALLWKSQMLHDRQQVKGEQLMFSVRSELDPKKEIQ